MQSQMRKVMAQFAVCSLSLIPSLSRSLLPQLPSVVTTYPREHWSREIPFHIAVCCLELFGELQKGAFYLVLSYDESGKLASEFLTSRLPVPGNVILGFTHVGDELGVMTNIKTWLRNAVSPNIMESDGLPLINWHHPPAQPLSLNLRLM